MKSLKGCDFKKNIIFKAKVNNNIIKTIIKIYKNTAFTMRFYNMIIIIIIIKRFERYDIELFLF